MRSSKPVNSYSAGAMWYTVLSLFAVVFIIKKIITFRQLARGVGDLPGYRTAFDSALGDLLPKIPILAAGNNYFFKSKHSAFAQAGCDVMTHVGMFPSTAVVIVADAALVKEITTSRSRFPKNVELYRAFSVFGPNILASEGDAWRRYRKIASPGFSERNNKLVFDESVLLMRDIFKLGWENKKEVTIDNCFDLTLSISVRMISIAGFGLRMSWKKDKVPPPGHLMTLEHAMHIVTSYVIQRLLLPDWAMGLTTMTREIDLGFKEIKSYVIELIEHRKNSAEMDRHDLLSNLILASASDGETEGLSAEEVLSNIYLFLLAGHETTALSLCFAFGLLALYPDEQEKLYEQIISVVNDPEAPKYDEIPLLTRSLAVMYESLRMFPSASAIPKHCAEDTTLTTTNAKGETVVIPVPKGTGVWINLPGLHYNPKYWKDPHSFNPDRFLQHGWNKDAFLPFSAGARSCIGRRFSEVESVAVITTMVAQYKITVTDDPRFAGETWEQKKECVLRTTKTMTIRPAEVPLTFTRRT